MSQAALKEQGITCSPFPLQMGHKVMLPIAGKGLQETNVQTAGIAEP